MWIIPVSAFDSNSAVTTAMRRPHVHIGQTAVVGNLDQPIVRADCDDATIGVTLTMRTPEPRARSTILANIGSRCFVRRTDGSLPAHVTVGSELDVAANFALTGCRLTWTLCTASAVIVMNLGAHTAKAPRSGEGGAGMGRARWLTALADASNLPPGGTASGSRVGRVV